MEPTYNFTASPRMVSLRIVNGLEENKPIKKNIEDMEVHVNGR